MNPAALIGVVVCGLLGACGASAEPAADQAGAAITAEANKAASCRWQPMAVGGGGFNMSQEIAPGARTRVIRTDSYGAYRWENNRWVQLITSTSMPPEDVAPDLRTAGGRLWVAGGAGVYRVDIADTSNQLTWVTQSRGIEQLVANDVVSPPGGKPVLAGWDFGLRVSEDVNQFLLNHEPFRRFNSVWQLDWSPSNPAFLAALDRQRGHLASDRHLSVRFAGRTRGHGRRQRGLRARLHGLGRLRLGGGRTPLSHRRARAGRRGCTAPAAHDMLRRFITTGPTGPHPHVSS